MAALLIISSLSVHKQYHEEKEVEVGDWGSESGWQRPRKRHDPERNASDC